MFKKIAIKSFCSLLFITSTSSAFALPITVIELIEDQAPFELLDRNLTRTRSDSDGFLQVESDDATIITENQINDGFGVYGPRDVIFRHLLTWINPPAANFIGLSLEIKSFGIDGGNDIAFAETLNLGSLINDGSILENFTTTISTNNMGSTLNLILADGILNITVDKNNGAQGFGLLESSSVFSSKLTAQYNEVPEPLSLVLLGSGLLCHGLRRRKLI